MYPIVAASSGWLEPQRSWLLCMASDIPRYTVRAELSGATDTLRTAASTTTSEIATNLVVAQKLSQLHTDDQQGCFQPSSTMTAGSVFMHNLHGAWTCERQTPRSYQICAVLLLSASRSLASLHTDHGRCQVRPLTVCMSRALAADGGAGGASTNVCFCCKVRAVSAEWSGFGRS